MAAAGRGLGCSFGHPRVPIHTYIRMYLGHACRCNDFTALHASNVLCKPQKIPEYRECPSKINGTHETTMPYGYALMHMYEVRFSS